MSNLKLLYKILRLMGMKITDFWFKNRNKELHLAVKPYKNGCRCPECGRRGRIIRQTTEFRRWEDLTLMGMKVLLWYAPIEILCPTHGRMQDQLPRHLSVNLTLALFKGAGLLSPQVSS